MCFCFIFFCFSYFLYFIYLTLNNTKHFSHKHFVSHLFVCVCVRVWVGFLIRFLTFVALLHTGNSRHAEQFCVFFSDAYNTLLLFKVLLYVRKISLASLINYFLFGFFFIVSLLIIYICSLPISASLTW